MPSAIVDRMIGNIFGSEDSYLDFKLAPTLARVAESKAEAEIKISEAKAKQIEMSSALDNYRTFATTSKDIIRSFGDVTCVDPDELVRQMAEQVGITLRANSGTKLPKSK